MTSLDSDISFDIPGLIAIVDNELVSEPAKTEIHRILSARDLYQLLLKQGYSSVLFSPEDILDIGDDLKYSIMSDFCLLICDLALVTDGLNEVDFIMIGKIINRIMEEKERLLIIFFSQFGGNPQTDQVIIRDVHKQIKDENLEKIRILGTIKKGQKLKSFVNLINSYLNDENIKDEVLLFAWESILRKSLNKTINSLIGVDENSIEKMCHVFENQFIGFENQEPEIQEESSKYKYRMISSKLNEILSNLLASFMKKEVDYVKDSTVYLKLIEDILSTQPETDMQDLLETDQKYQELLVLKDKIKDEISELINEPRSELKNDEFKLWLETNKGFKKLKIEKKHIQEQIEEISKKYENDMRVKKENQKIWELEIKTLLNLSQIEEYPNSYSVFTGLLVVDKEKDRDKPFGGYLIITPRCQIQHGKTEKMQCLRIYLNITESEENHTFNYFKRLLFEVFPQIENKDLSSEDKKKVVLSEYYKKMLSSSKSERYERFFVYKYFDMKHERKLKFLIDFSNVRTIHLVEFHKDYIPYLIVEDSLLENIILEFTHYIGRKGIFDFN